MPVYGSTAHSTPCPSPRGADDSDTISINASGWILGSYSDMASESHGYLLTPLPPVPAAPAVKISGAKKVTTAKAKLTIKGKATGAVSSVTYRIGSKPAKRAKGTASWSLKPRSSRAKTDRRDRARPGRRLRTRAAHRYAQITHYEKDHHPRPCFARRSPFRCPLPLNHTPLPTSTISAAE